MHRRFSLFQMIRGFAEKKDGCLLRWARKTFLEIDFDIVYKSCVIGQLKLAKFFINITQYLTAAPLQH